MSLTGGHLVLCRRARLPITGALMASGGASHASATTAFAASTGDDTTRTVPGDRRSLVGRPVARPLLRLFTRCNVSPFVAAAIDSLRITLNLITTNRNVALIPTDLRAIQARRVDCRQLVRRGIASPVCLRALGSFMRPGVPSLLDTVCRICRRHNVACQRRGFASVPWVVEVT